jgi:hypothetical protein
MTSKPHDRRYVATEESASPPHCGLPPRMRLLWVGAAEPSWVSMTLELDGEGCHPRFDWASTAAEALGLLRRETVDCVVLAGAGPSLPANDPVTLAAAIRAGGFDGPVVLVTEELGDLQWASACRLECEVLVTARQWDSRALVPVIRRALSAAEVMRENRRLGIAHQKRLARERDEAEQLLNHQRQIVRELERSPGDSVRGASRRAGGHTAGGFLRSSPGRSLPQRLDLPAEFEGYYHELLRAYVMMGSGNLGCEIAKLAELLAAADISPRDALTLHLEQVERLVRGLGNRSTRHVMARADLLALELSIHLGECYQRRP